MPDYLNLPSRDANGALNVVVECPRNARVKVAYDPQTRAFKLRRLLPIGLAYPYDWGFVPRTRAEDGDPLDAMVLYDASTWPGVIIASRAIAVVRIRQSKPDHSGTLRNDRIIFAPVVDEDHHDLENLNAKLRRELEAFFVSVARLAGKEVTPEGWETARAANELIDEACRKYATQS